MNTLKTKLITILLLFLLTGLSNCGKIEDGLASLKWQINFDLVNTSWDLLGQDDERRVEVFLTGPDHLNILDMAGIKQKNFYSTKGFLGMILHPDRASPSESDPVQFTIHAKIDGYLPVHVPVEAFGKGIHPVEILMVNLEHPPLGVNVFHQEGLSKVVYGQIEDSLILYTPGNRLEVIVPKGTEFKDEAGQLLGGSLTITMALWDCTKETAMEALLGGPLALINFKEFELGIKQPASQLFIRIQDEYGKLATQMSQSLLCTFLVDPGIFHPQEGRSVAPADILPVYQLDNLTGNWSRENTVVLEAFQNKVLARITIHQSGTFHFGWMDQNYCEFPLPMGFTTLESYDVLPYSFRLKVYRNYNGHFQYLYAFNVAGKTDEVSELRYLPIGKELIVRFESYITCADPYYKNPDPLLLSGECGPFETLDNDLVPVPPGTIREMEVVFIDTQHNRTEYTPASFAGYYRKLGSACWKSALVYDGITHLFDVLPDEVYEMGINYKGQFHRKEVLITEGGMMRVEIDID